MGVSICLWQSEDNFSDILRKASLWKDFSLSWNLPIRLAGPASRPQGSSQALVLWVCVTMLAFWHDFWGRNSCLHVCEAGWTFPPELFLQSWKNKIHENELKANRQKTALGVEGFGWRWGTRETSQALISPKELGRFRKPLTQNNAKKIWEKNREMYLKRTEDISCNLFQVISQYLAMKGRAEGLNFNSQRDGAKNIWRWVKWVFFTALRVYPKPGKCWVKFLVGITTICMGGCWQFRKRSRKLFVKNVPSKEGWKSYMLETTFSFG